MKTIRDELIIKEQKLFELDREIEITKSHRKLLLDINSPKTDLLAANALSVLNWYMGARAKLENEINNQCEILAKLKNSYQFWGDLELAAINIMQQEMETWLND